MGARARRPGRVRRDRFRRRLRARLTIENNRAFGVNLSDEGTRARLEAATLRATRPRASDGRFGRALNVQLGAEATVIDTTITDSREVAVAAIEGAQLVLERVQVQGTDSQQSDGRFGRALNVQSGSVAEVRESSFTTSRGVAVWVGGADARATLTDVTVSDTRAQACSDDCPQGAGGVGLASYLGGDVDVTGFTVERSSLCGVHVALGSDLDLAEGEIRDNTIGACVQVPDYDLDRLRDDVRYRNNEVNLDTVDLPVPEPLPE